MWGRFARGLLPTLSLLCACSSEPSGPNPGAVPDVPSEVDPGAEVTVSVPESAGELERKLEQARGATADDLRSAHTVGFDEQLGYDPLAAERLDEIFAALSEREAPDAQLLQLAHLGRQGFVVLDGRARPPSFAAGYAEIYMADLPVFVSADMVLEAIYRSHDKILQSIEKEALRPRVQDLLLSIRKELIDAADTMPDVVASDLNFYLGVALSLLDGGRVDRREPDGVAAFVDAAMKADGEQERVLFGVKRRMDFSQFEPRGHYAGDPELESYFRAMMWLGRIDFRLIETRPDGTQVFRRRQVEAMLALRRLVEPDFAHYESIDETIGAFAGEHDYMTLQDADAFLAALDAPQGIDGIDDGTLATALVDGQFGDQRIASHVMRRLPGGPSTFALNTSFALFGQRYTVDSHVLSNVVYDRLPTRVVPDSLDVAFGALGNDQAVALLGDELDDEAGYPGQLSAIRLLVDEHPDEYWHGSLYTTWLNALRTLSPVAGRPHADVPAVARTEAWGRRLLNTQLSSWAQLRHNSVLYAKQSYTSSALCEYPDAYVDPYPELFTNVVRLAERGQELMAELDLGSDLGTRIQDYFGRVARINGILAEMAERQRTGAPHSEEHMAFINQAVTMDVNCDGTILGHTGWYSELHFDPLQAVEADPVITDVHTDIGGPLPVSRPPSVLHVGTALPRMMVMTVESCTGPRAYAGVVSSFHEVLENGLTRLTDEEWKDRLVTGVVDTPRWLQPILSP